MTRDSKGWRTGVAVEAVDVCRLICQYPASQEEYQAVHRTMSPNLYLKVAARFAQNARSSEPGGWKSSAGGPPEDIRLERW